MPIETGINSIVKVAVMGLGKMGISHCSIINAHPDVKVISICDSSTFVLEAFKKYSKKSVYTDYRKMLDENDINAVIVATPTKFHYEMVSYALSKYIHVFCEKPFALKIPEAEEMVRNAAERRLVNQVGYHNRFIGTFQEVKRLLETKVIGKPYHFSGQAYGPVVLKEKSGSWRSERREGGGCLYDYSSHVINLIDYVLGVPRKVKGTLLKRIFSKNVEDAVYSTLILENGLSGTLSVNWSDETFRKMSTSITVWGKEGKIVADAQQVKIYVNRENKIKNLRKGWNIKFITDLTSPVNFFLRGEEYSSQMDYFIDHVKNRNLENLNSFESALRTDRVIDLLIKDAEIL